MTIKKPQQLYPRGAEWRQWDLHIHIPASFHWNGQRFDSKPNSSENTKLVDEMMEALNTAEPAVFALMDYWTFDGWFALKKRLERSGPVWLDSMFHSLSGASRCSAYAAVRRAGRLLKYTPSGV